MADLATEDDLEARLGRSLTSAEQTRAAAFLADASALIRRYTKQDFEAVSGDVVTLRPIGTTIRLPQRPVTAVNSVSALDWAGASNIVLPSGFWGFDGIDIIEIAPYSSNVWLTLPTVELGDDLPNTYQVDYDHGGTIPDDVIAVCCGMVLRVLLAPSLVEGMSSERIGEYSYQMGQFAGGGSAGVTVRLSEADKDALGAYRRKAATVQVRF